MTYDQLTMLRELTDAPGVPGQEAPVREVMHRYLEPLGEIVTDNLGGIAAYHVGQEGGPRVMIAGHLDEVGFMVTRITDNGFLKFQTLGGWLEQVLLSQQVSVQTRNGPLPGIIGSKPPHIVGPEERKKMITKQAMFIDIGASSKDEAHEWGVRPGDMIVPVCPFTVMRNEKLLMAKAWDNRMGCALALEVLRRLNSEPHPTVLYAAATAQEEVGLRGAGTLTHVIAPDIGFAFDTGIAGDVPGMDNPDSGGAGKLGEGPVVLLYDGSMVPHTGLRNLVIDVAEAEGIALQFDIMERGGTDGGKMHQFGAGVPSLVIGVPVRYIHTQASIMHRDDFDAAVNLVVAVVKRLDRATVQQIQQS